VNSGIIYVDMVDPLDGIVTLTRRGRRAGEGRRAVAIMLMVMANESPATSVALVDATKGDPARKFGNSIKTKFSYKEIAYLIWVLE
jgi:hypothetical protein